MDARTVALARAPDLRVGRGLFEPFLRSIDGPFALVAQPEPLVSIDPVLVRRAAAVLEARTLEEEALDALVRDLPDVERIVGFGGGVAMDAAKYVAWRSERPLSLAPGIVSVDASVTNSVAVRRGGRVEYVGFVVADPIIADLDVISRAPPRLNRAGVGDLLSIQTGRVDWALGARAGRIAFDADADADAARVLEELYPLADDVADVTDRALEHVVRAYARVNAICLDVGHSGPEEGSEHYFAYAAEAHTGRSFVHGEIIGLGVVLMSWLQGAGQERAAAFLDRCQVAWRPEQLGFERATLEAILLRLPAFVREAGLPWSIIDEAPLGPSSVATAMASLERLTT
jgi:glycerol-1-phosphate dehydrogenase [NAD(P)+]